MQRRATPSMVAGLEGLRESGVRSGGHRVGQDASSAGADIVEGVTTESNKRMQLTKLRAAPERQDKVPPCAPAGRMDGGTASQLIRSVRPT